MTSSLGNGIKTQASPGWEIHPLDSTLSPSQGAEGQEKTPTQQHHLFSCSNHHMPPAPCEHPEANRPGLDVPSSPSAWMWPSLEEPRALHHTLGMSHVPKTRKVRPHHPDPMLVVGDSGAGKPAQNKTSFLSNLTGHQAKLPAKGTLSLLEMLGCLSTQLYHPALPQSVAKAFGEPHRGCLLVDQAWTW